VATIGENLVVSIRGRGSFKKKKARQKKRAGAKKLWKGWLFQSKVQKKKKGCTKRWGRQEFPAKPLTKKKPEKRVGPKKKKKGRTYKK